MMTPGRDNGLAAAVLPIQDSPSRELPIAYGGAQLQPSDRIKWLLAVQVDRSLPRNAAVVANVLAIFANGSTGLAYPGNDEIAAAAGVHRTTCYRVLKSLESAGFVARRPGGGRGNATTWQLINRSDTSATVCESETVAVQDVNRSSLELNRSKKGPKPYQHSATPTGNRDPTGKEQGEKPAKKPAQKLTPPDWLPAEAWDAWETHRREIKKPVTPSTARAQFAKLAGYLKDGHQPADVIEHSIAGGWQGLFPPDRKRINGHGGYETPHARLTRLNGGSGDADDGKTINGHAEAVASDVQHLRRR